MLFSDLILHVHWGRRPSQHNAQIYSLPQDSDQDETQLLFDRSCALEAMIQQLVRHSAHSDHGKTPGTKVGSFAVMTGTIEGLGSGVGKSSDAR